MTQYITKDSTIGDVVAKYPQVAPVFLKFGLHCVGCHVAVWETLEEGCMGHGMPEEDFRKLLKEANEVASKNEDDRANRDPRAPIFITEHAVDMVKTLMGKHKTQGLLRIRVIDSGCCSKGYDFAVEDKAEEGDTVFEKDGLTVAIASDSIDYLQNATVDFVESPEGSGFKVETAQEQQESCACKGEKSE